MIMYQTGRKDQIFGDGVIDMMAFSKKPARLGETMALNDCRVKPSDVSREYATQCLQVPPTCATHHQGKAEPDLPLALVQTSMFTYQPVTVCLLMQTVTSSSANGITCRSNCVLVHTVGFRVVLTSKSLAHLNVLRVVGLQAAHERGCQRAGQVGVLAESFVPAAPARVTENVDVGAEAVQVPAGACSKHLGQIPEALHRIIASLEAQQAHKLLFAHTATRFLRQMGASIMALCRCSNTGEGQDWQ